MPTYSYQCKSCEHYFEELLKIAEMNVPVGEPCPECGKSEINKILTAPPKLVDPVSVGRVKVNSDFSNMLSGMKRYYKGSTINDSH